MKRKLAFLILLILILGLVGCKGVHLGGHSYGQWQTVQKATCLEDGLQERVCTCGAKETQVLPALGHAVVVDEAKAATCTVTGVTEGSHCSRCDAVLQEQQVITVPHVTEETPSIEPNCTRAGKEAGAYCTVCGEYVISPQKIRQNGHKYVNGVCTVCNAVRPDMAAAIMINELNDAGVPNFCTKQAYPAGSTITFDAYVPADSTWWAVSWIQNPEEATLYKWTEGAGIYMDVETGKWQTCTVTLPSNGGSYYIYIVGAKGEWGNMPLMIDNVTITNAGGTVLGTDSFSEDVAGGLFDVVKINRDSHRPAVFLHEACPGHWYVTDAATEPNCEEAGLTKGYHCGNCGRILKEQKEIPALGHQWDGENCSVCGKLRQDMVAALRIDNLNASAPMNFITKEAYAGGSTVKFQAYVPFGVTWWTVNWTTDPAQGDLYVGFSGQGQDMNGYTQMGKWAEYTVNLPNDGKQYYIYFVGAKGEWNNRELLINNLTITDKEGTLLASEDFDSGVKACIFDVTELNSDNQKVAVSSKVLEDPCENGHTVVIHPSVEPTCSQPGLTEGQQCSVCGQVLVAQQELPATGHVYGPDGVCECGAVQENRSAAIHVDNMNAAGKMNFITRDAYAGGSILSFRAFVPENVTWWTVNWTTDPAQGDLYVGFGGQGQDMNGVTQKGQWTNYTVTLPDDGKQYYIYFAGAKSEWNGQELLIDDVILTDKHGKTVLTDNFDNGMYGGLFSITECNENGELVVREVSVVECLHINKTKDADVLPTCVDGGYLSKAVCADCGITLYEKIPQEAMGHQWENGECTVCHEKEEQELPAGNYAASIHIDNLTETAPMSFITKQAYPGGSTVKFRAFVPNEATWWTVNWTTDPAKGDLYVGFSGQGQDMNGVTKKGQWAEYTVHLPNDGKQYYIYFVGAKGEWQGKTLLIDDVVITLPGGTAVTENFNSTAEQSMFNIVETAVQWEYLGELEEEQPPAGNYAASIHIDNLTESAPMSFITKQAYPGGSTVKFRAYVPNEATWWTVNWTTDPAKGDLYVGFSGQGQDMNGVTQKGQWAEYTVHLPNDGKQYYIYFVGAKGEWQGKTLLIDDVVITPPGGTAVTENFNSTAEQSMFNVVETAVQWEYLGELEEEQPPAGNYAASIHIDNLTETAPMSFITKQAYPGGSTVKFRAFVPNEATWWTVNWTTDPAKGDLYVGFSGQGQDMNGVTKKGQWAEYTVHLPNDGKQYYIYFVGAKGEWKGKTLLIDDVVITPPGGTAVTENFNSTAEQSMFNIVETAVQWEYLGELEEEQPPAGNYAASIHIDNLTETAPMSFITKQAYPGGSTVKFQAFVPNEATWWTVNWTTDPAKGDLYVGFSGQGQDMNGVTKKGQWAEYTVHLPNDGKQYYIYFVGAKGEWKGKTLLIDDVVITPPGGTAVTENFNSTAEQSMFNIVETAVQWKLKEE